ncbi:MAG: hypothetical protein HQ536_04445 [Parcubacteria group bacterium]|nr:hypothetical protein [Parcubacteria group bacterium]
MSEQEWRSITRDYSNNSCCIFLGAEGLKAVLKRCSIFTINVRGKVFRNCTVSIESVEKEWSGPDGPTGSTYKFENAFAKTVEGIEIRLGMSTLLREHKVEHNCTIKQKRQLAEEIGVKERELRELIRQFEKFSR